MKIERNVFVIFISYVSIFWVHGPRSMGPRPMWPRPLPPRHPQTSVNAQSGAILLSPRPLSIGRHL